MNLQAAPAATDASAPTRIGRFYLTRELGRGATGCVYLGHDPVIGRDIALKTLNPRLPLAQRRRHAESLINEVRAAGRLCHPHIVTIHDACSEGDTPYIAMEYLQGRALDCILGEGRRFTPEEIASIGWKLADALDHAHRCQVVHRDVKPSNIFLVGDDQPKLMDFGIARAPNRIGETADAEQAIYTMFRPNSPLGTPNYMSPEQAQGKPADERSDIYSLGAVLYEMLAGRKPFDERDPDRLLQQIACKAPPALYEVNPEVPPLLAQIVTKAMSKRPEKRYPDAQQMARDLKRFLLLERRERRRRMTSESEGADSAAAPAPAAPTASNARWIWVGALCGAAAVAAAWFTLDI